MPIGAPLQHSFISGKSDSRLPFALCGASYPTIRIFTLLLEGWSHDHPPTYLIRPFPTQLTTTTVAEREGTPNWVIARIPRYVDDFSDDNIASVDKKIVFHCIIVFFHPFLTARIFSVGGGSQTQMLEEGISRSTHSIYIQQICDLRSPRGELPGLRTPVGELFRCDRPLLCRLGIQQERGKS